MFISKFNIVRSSSTCHALNGLNHSIQNKFFFQVFHVDTDFYKYILPLPIDILKAVIIEIFKKCVWKKKKINQETWR